MDSWDSFFVAEAGASAALAGLVFVSISINLQKILSFKPLPGRAMEALGLLLSVLALSLLLLVPRQPMALIGLEVLGVGLITWALVVTLVIKSIRDLMPGWRTPFIARIVMGQFAALPLIIAGVQILIQGESSADGLYWLVPGFLFCFAQAALDAWVLLVEIKR